VVDLIDGHVKDPVINKSDVRMREGIRWNLPKDLRVNIIINGL